MKRLWPLLLLSLTACAPKVSGEVVTQTMRAGNLEITVSAPERVTRQELYPLKVTYTNRGKQSVEFSDPFHCSLIWDVQEVNSGKPLEPLGNYGCTADIPALKKLAPDESYAGEFSAIISGYPAGEYRITPEQLRQLSPLNYHAGDIKAGYGQPLTPPPKEIRFQIR